MDQALNSTSQLVAEEAPKDVDGKREELQKMISSLPREMGLTSNDEFMHKYQGFWYSPAILEKALTQPPSPEWNLSPSDVLLCCNPKCGTTWLKALAFAIATRNRYPQDAGPESSPLLTSLPHNLIPFIEFLTSARSDVSLPLFSTHMPYSLLPKSVLECGCKLVYICRDPKDAFVSRLHFIQKIRAHNNHSAPAPIDQSVDLFCRGVTPFGPHLDHVLGYWEASLEHPEKVLFLKYEDMVRDPVSHVIRLAGFMGYDFSEEEERRGVPRSVVEMCSFDRLSNLEVNKGANTSSMMFKGTSVSNDSFFRKGKVGDWRNCLTQEMADKIDQISTEKLGPGFWL